MQALDLSFANSDLVVGNVPNYYAQLEHHRLPIERKAEA